MGALPARIQSVPVLLVFTDRGVAPILYGSVRSLLPGGVLLDMRHIVKVAKGGREAIAEFLRKVRKVKEFIPYESIEEIRMERRALPDRMVLARCTVIVIRLKDGGERVYRIIAGEGMGITKEEYLEMFRRIADSVPVKMVISEEVQQ